MAEKIRKAYTRRIQPHPCAHCGGTTQQPKYCSPRCRERSRPKRIRPSPDGWHRKLLVERTCVVCDAVFQRPGAKGRDAGRCCSRECGFVLLRKERAENRAKFDLVRAARRQFALWAKQARQKLTPERDTRKRCRDCGDVTEKHQQRCGSCKVRAAEAARERNRLSPSYLACKRAAKARRRAIERGVEAERFDPIEVLARDGWRCHICGISTPKRLRGSFDDRAPELDHIIPLAAGGDHTRQNTACACRKCNIAKGSQPLGQLRLVA